VIICRDYYDDVHDDDVHDDDVHDDDVHDDDTHSGYGLNDDYT
jgi:hypothetical protein